MQGNTAVFLNATDGNSCCKILKFLDLVNKRRGVGATDTEAIINVAKNKWLHYDSV